MRVAFDTSVIVAGSIRGHVHEPRAAPWFAATGRSDVTACVTTHALAETWATLTAIPTEPRLAPVLVGRLLDRLRSRVEVVELWSKDYDQAFARCGEGSLRSGAVYDALHLVAAERWKADVFLTFNVRDFERLAVADGPRILAPPDPPGVEPALR